MKEINLRVLERQSLSVVLEDSLYVITIKECSGVMAISIERDGVMLIEGRRAVAGMFLIPFEYLELGNFAFVTENDELPYYTGFNSTNQLVYFTVEEVQALGVVNG